MAIAFVAALGSLVLWCGKPCNRGTTRSARFSASEFKRIKAGDSIESVIDRLGAPITVSDAWNYNGHTVRTYVFAGEPTSWWVWAYSSAWVLVGPDNRVVA